MKSNTAVASGVRSGVRYQFVDGHGRRRHFSTKARAKLERDKAKALFTQEGKLAAGMDEQHRRRTSNHVLTAWLVIDALRAIRGKPPPADDASSDHRGDD